MADIEIQDLRKEFQTPHGVEIAVNDIDLDILDNEFVSLVGPSGCGKTTTLRCVAGLETPTSGRILLNGEDITDLPPNKRDIAMMFQSIALYPHMTVMDNISYPLKVDGVSRSEREGPAREVAKTMQIERMVEKHPGDLSGGQQQRAALARTIVQEPDAFLMDEPLSDLDAKLKVEIRKEIQKLHRKLQKPVLYVTHDQEEAMTMSDRIAILNDGNIEQFDTPKDIFRKPANEFVGQFIGNHGMNVLPAEVVEFGPREATLRLEDREFDLEYDEVLGPAPTDRVKLGFRPERTSLGRSDDAILTGETALLETFGEDTIVSIDTALGSINALIESESDVEEGEQTDISIDRHRAHLFDAETGEVVVHTQ